MTTEVNVLSYGRIRRAHRDGMGIREIARTFGHSRRKIREALQAAEPQPYTLRQPRPRRVTRQRPQSHLALSMSYVAQMVEILVDGNEIVVVVTSCMVAYLWEKCS